MFVAFDTETTGVDRGSRLVEIAAVKFDLDGSVSGVYDQLINPGMPVPADVEKIHGITNAAVEGRPDAGEVLAHFFRWIPPRATLVGHYAMFDTGVVSWDAGRFGVAIPDGLGVVCTRGLAAELGETKNNKLDTLIEKHGLERDGDSHRALADSEACRQYFCLVQDQVHYRAVPWADAGHDYAYTDALPDMLRALPELVASAGSFSFRYEDKDGKTTERRLTPYGWALKDDIVYFHGRCHTKDARRLFRSDRVLGVSL